MSTVTLKIPAEFAGTFRDAVFSELAASGEYMNDALNFYGGGEREPGDPEHSPGELIGSMVELNQALLDSVKYEPPDGDTDAETDTEAEVTDYTAAQILREVLGQSGGRLADVLGAGQVARGNAEREAQLVKLRTWARSEAERHGLDLGEGEDD